MEDTTTSIHTESLRALGEETNIFPQNNTLDVPGFLTIDCARGPVSPYKVLVHVARDVAPIKKSELRIMNSLADQLNRPGLLLAHESFPDQRMNVFINPAVQLLPPFHFMTNRAAAVCLFRTVGYLLPARHPPRPFGYSIYETATGVEVANGGLARRRVGDEQGNSTNIDR